MFTSHKHLSLISFLSRYPDIKRHKASALDPARASQATHEVAVDFETMVNGVLTRMSNDPDIDFTWTLPLTHM